MSAEKSAGKLLKKPHLLNNMRRKLDLYNDNKSIEKIYKLSKKFLKD